MNLRIALAHAPGPPAGDPRLSADIVAYPELVDGGYAALVSGRGTHTLADDFLRRFRTTSRGTAPVVIAGSVRMTNGSRGCTNSSLVFSRGRVIHRYDKIHLFHPTGDHRYFVPGTTAGTVRVTVRRHHVRLGVVICFDLRFPELVRALAFRGIDLLVVPARWPAQRAAAWETLLRARAIENQVFVAGCNAAGREGGPSFVFGPDGTPVARVRPPSAGADLYDLDLDAIRRARRLYHPFREARWYGSARHRMRRAR